LQNPHLRARKVFRGTIQDQYIAGCQTKLVVWFHLSNATSAERDQKYAFAADIEFRDGFADRRCTGV
jgi:hypothetical protein